MTEQYPAQQRPQDRLWVPGMALDDEFPLPTDEHMQSLWADYNPGTTVESCTEVFGVYSVPNRPISGVASIDLCEVVRETRLSMFRISGLEVGRDGFGVSEVPYERSYAAETWYDLELVDNDFAQSIIVTIARVLMKDGLVQPVEHIDAIASIIRNWRKQGIYCVANTSTLPGCEAGTITHTLGNTLPGCFDALVLPRNHDGLGRTTKAAALASAAAEAGLALDAMPLVHIDDAAPHIRSFQDHYTNKADMKLLSPVHYLKAVSDEELQCETPLEAFFKAHQHFKQTGAIAT